MAGYRGCGGGARENVLPVLLKRENYFHREELADGSVDLVAF